jgi:hypothetical protein
MGQFNSPSRQTTKEKGKKKKEKKEARWAGHAHGSAARQRCYDRDDRGLIDQLIDRRGGGQHDRCKLIFFFFLKLGY